MPKEVDIYLQPLVEDLVKYGPAGQMPPILALLLAWGELLGSFDMELNCTPAPLNP